MNFTFWYLTYQIRLVQKHPRLPPAPLFQVGRNRSPLEIGVRGVREINDNYTNGFYSIAKLCIPTLFCSFSKFVFLAKHVLFTNKIARNKLHKKYVLVIQGHLMTSFVVNTLKKRFYLVVIGYWKNQIPTAQVDFSDCAENFGLNIVTRKELSTNNENTIFYSLVLKNQS